jgi:molybdate transport system ATP-binding protein
MIHPTPPSPYQTAAGDTRYIRFEASKMLHTAQGQQLLDISFQMDKGMLLTLYGPSGAGKTTILRILAGLTDTVSADIEVAGEIWESSSRKIHLPTPRRSIGFVFQDFALFPNLTVRQQLEFALPKGTGKAKGTGRTIGRAAGSSIVTELLTMMELEELQDRRPSLLSGGQQQRVALARAIARKPKLLLLDEPLSAIDDEMRFKLQDYILTAHRHYQLTTILVSHSLPEIFRLSDEVIGLDKGRIYKQGSPSDIFLEEKISGKFRVTGEIIDIVPADIIFIVSVHCANTIVKVIATAEEITRLYVGQKVMVASKAFNPVILPISVVA